MIGNGVMVLQTCTDLQKGLPGSCSETCLTSFHDGNEVMSIKVEAVTVDEDPLLLTFPGVKAEHEVSCIFCQVCKQYPTNNFFVYVLHFGEKTLLLYTSLKMSF
jgi:hypothetical protein